MNQIEELIQQIRQFAEEREWEQFHSPKNLAMALVVEAGEIVEIFQWMTEEQSRHLDEATLIRLEEEIGDVLLYLAGLAGKAGIDPLGAARRKLTANAVRYPAEVVRGKSKKYTEY